MEGERREARLIARRSHLGDACSGLLKPTNLVGKCTCVERGGISIEMYLLRGPMYWFTAGPKFDKW